MLKHLCHFNWHCHFQLIRIIGDIQILTSPLLKHIPSIRTPDVQAALTAEVCSVQQRVDFYLHEKGLLLNLSQDFFLYWSKLSTYNNLYF